MTSAPEVPTTRDLHQAYPLTAEAELNVGQMRGQVSAAIQNYLAQTLGIIGYCARPGVAQAEVIMHESRMISEVNDAENGLVVLHRGPMWKPRTNPDDWHGEETTDPEGAYMTMRDQAEAHANLAVEIGKPYQLSRYGHLLSFIWTGGRSIDDGELMKAVALEDPTLPLGIKNGLDGNIDRAMEQIAYVEELRGSEAAPVVLIYRGGSKAKTPEEWKEAVLEVHEATGGRYLLDTAHGSEMAHHPDGNFQKSEEGQIEALASANRLVGEGNANIGAMMEASELESPTDPHMPLSIAINGIRQQHQLKLNLQAAQLSPI